MKTIKLKSELTLIIVVVAYECSFSAERLRKVYINNNITLTT